MGIKKIIKKAIKRKPTEEQGHIPVNNEEELPVVNQGSVRHKKKYEHMTRKDKKKLKYHGDKSYLVKMMFSNGTTREFVIKTKDETFVYQKRTYYLKYDEGWYNLTQNQYELIYMDDFAVPINRAIDVKGDKAFFSVTPENLAPLIKMNYVKVLAQSQDLDRKLTTSLMLMVCCMLLMIINAVLTFRLYKLIASKIGG